LAVSITAAKGFRAASVIAGIKPSGRSDVALVVNDGPSFAAAGVFTGNRIKAAPVVWSQQVLTAGKVHAVVLNAGNANACTGSRGFQDSHKTAETVAALLEVSAAEVAVCSTGLIGEFLPMQKLLAGVRAVVDALDETGGTDAARAIMTTDTVVKEAATSALSGWVVGGMAKGAGMLAPALATMLVVVTTDAIADAATLDAALRQATAMTFDRLDSDGCMSTNDTVLLLASGASGVQADPDELTAAVTEVCQSLAEQLIDDCEGASKVIEITVMGAASDLDGLEVARAVSRSNLLKCAIHGQDPNWGRILAALGTSRATFDADAVDVAINGVWICRASTAGADRSEVDMTARRVSIVIDLHAGDDEVTLLTTDLTAAYVHENSAYSS
jgi:glutamate N-acetyltransferase/amino-acid N-acetyltransferase